MRIAILDDYLDVALTSAPWDSLPESCEVTRFEYHLGDDASVTKALLDFDVIVAMRERTTFPAAVIEALPNLKLLITTGMRNLSIDMAAARACGVDVCGTGMTSYAAFEHTWAMIMGLAKNIAKEDRCMREGLWQTTLAIGLKGRTLGVIGLGKLGSQVAQIGLAFGMKVVAWSQNLTSERAAEIGVECVSKEELLSRSDIVTIHLILSERTRHLIGERELSQMKPTAFLVNTSRGPIVDENALIEALQDKKIAGAGIDVYDIEPLPVHHPLRSIPNTLLTGHTGYVLEETFQLAYGDAVENIRAWLDESPVRLLNAA